MELEVLHFWQIPRWCGCRWSMNHTDRSERPVGRAKKWKRKSCGPQPQLSLTFTALNKLLNLFNVLVTPFSSEVVKRQEEILSARGVLDQEKHYKESWQRIYLTEGEAPSRVLAPANWDGLSAWVISQIPDDVSWTPRKNCVSCFVLFFLGVWGAGEIQEEKGENKEGE